MATRRLPSRARITSSMRSRRPSSSSGPSASHVAWGSRSKMSVVFICLAPDYLFLARFRWMR